MTRLHQFLHSLLNLAMAIFTVLVLLIVVSLVPRRLPLP